MPEMAPAAMAGLLRRDRALCIVLLAAICLLAWVYTLAGGGVMPRDGMMPGHGGEAAPAGLDWSLSHGLAMVVMWWVMMVAMMLPSATPVILLAAALNRRASGTALFPATAIFVAGYLLVWLGFSLAATVAQALLSRAGLLTPGMASARDGLSGLLLLAAGFWQLSSAKAACLRHCRSPVDWLIRHRGQGWRGALAVGLGHGGYCLGCCWALMLLLFVGGVMSPLWIAGLALLVLLEKLAPGGAVWRRITGALLLISGGLVLLP